MEITILIIQVLLKYGPDVAAKVRQMLAKTTVEEADWTALWALIDKPGESYFAPQVKP